MPQPERVSRGPQRRNSESEERSARVTPFSVRVPKICLSMSGSWSIWNCALVRLPPAKVRERVRTKPAGGRWRG